jgi:hypothetical protein
MRALKIGQYLVALLAVLFSVSTRAAVCTWEGSSGASWANNINWDCSNGPVNGDSLVFPAVAANKVNIHDRLALTSVVSVTIASGYTISGNALTVTSSNPVAANSGAEPISFSNALTLTGTSPITVSTTQSNSNPIDFGSLTWSGTLRLQQANFGGTRMTLNSPAAARFELAGGSLVLDNASIMNGQIEVGPLSLLVARNVGALGATGAGAETIVLSGGSLDIRVSNIAETLQLADNDGNLSPPRLILPAAVSPPLIWSGPIQVTGRSAIDTLPSSGASAEITGVISGTGGVSFDGGLLRLKATNTYAGPTIVNPGAELEGTFGDVLPDTTELAVGPGAKYTLAAGVDQVSNLTILGTLELFGTLTTSSALPSVISGSVIGIGELIKAGSGPLQIDGSLSGAPLRLQSGTTTLAATSMQRPVILEGTARLITQQQSVVAFSGGAGGGSTLAIDGASGSVTGTLHATGGTPCALSTNNTIEFDVRGDAASQFDEFLCAGNINLSNAGASFNFTGSTAMPGVPIAIVRSLGTVNGIFESLPNNTYVPLAPAPSKYQVNYLSNQVTLTRAPILNANAINLSATAGASLNQSFTPSGGVGPILSATLSAAPLWLNANLAGGNVTLSGNVPAGATGTANYTITIVDSVGQTVVETRTITYTGGAPGTFTWNGSESDDWQAPNNWTPAALPTPGSILIFPSAGQNKTIINVPGGSFDYVELADGYTIAGTVQFTLTNATPIRFAAVAGVDVTWDTPLLLSNSNALVTLRGNGNGSSSSVTLGSTASGLNFSGNVRFEFSMQNAADTGFVQLDPRYAQTSQTGNVTYQRINGGGEHQVELRYPANYTGLTTIVGPALRVNLSDASGLGLAAGQTDTQLTDATLEIQTPIGNVSVLRERLLMNNVATASATTLRARNVDSPLVTWAGPIVTSSSFANFDAEDSGILQIDGIISGTAQARFGAGGNSVGTVRLAAQNTYSNSTEINALTTLVTGIQSALPERDVFFAAATAVLTLEAQATLGGLEGNSGGTINLGSSQLTLTAASALIFNGDIFGNTGSQLIMTGNQIFGGYSSMADGWRLEPGSQLTLRGAADLSAVRLNGGLLRADNASTATISSLTPFTAGSNGIIELGTNTLGVVNGTLAPGIQLRVSIDGSVPAVGRLDGITSLDLAGATLVPTQVAPLAIGLSRDIADAPELGGTLVGALPDSVVTISGSSYKIIQGESNLSIKRLGVLSNLLTVDTTVDGTITGTCSLRDAVISINNNEAPVGSACLNGAPNATIQFAPAVTGQINLVEGIGIASSMTIRGPGARVLTLNGVGSQILSIDGQSGPPLQVVVEDLRLFNGRSEQGGAIYNTEDLTLRRVHFDGNQAENAMEGFALGGAIFNDGALLAESSTFTNNGAIGSGMNNGARGGAILSSGPALIVNSTFSDNFTRASGTSVSGVNSCGGAVAGNADILHSTFAENQAESQTVGIAAGGAVCAFALETIAFQHSAVDQNRVITGGSATPGTIQTYFDAMATASADYCNVFELPVGATITNPITGQALLLPIANNGGPVDTIAFERESALKDAGGANPPSPPLFDARGRARIFGTAIDIGAFEQNLSITPTLPDGNVGANYSQTLLVTPPGTYTFMPENTGMQSFPPVLNLSASGVLSGTPTTPGTYTFRLRALAANGDGIFATYSITISNAAPIPTTAAFSPAIAPVAFAPGVTYTVNATISAASVPQGVVTIQAARLDQPTLTISCTPTVTNAANAINASCNLSPSTPGVWVTTVNFVGTAPYQNSTITTNAIVTANLPDVVPTQSLTQTVVGQPFSVSASYAGTAGWPIPRGQVTVTQFPAAVQVTAPLAAGAATINLISRSAVTKALLVTYLDNVDQVYNTQTVPIAHATLRAPTNVTASLSSTQGPPGQAVTVNYTIGVLAPGAVPPGSPGPSGSIEVRDGVDVATCAITGLSGSCSFTPSTLGLRSIFVRFVGDTDFAFSDSAPLAYTVGQAGTTSDVSITIGNAQRTINGNTSNYTISVRNLSSTGVGGVRVVNAVPAGALSQTITSCAASANSSCGNAANTSGTLDRLIDLGANGQVTFRVSVQLDSGEAPISSTATATVPAGITDPNPANNTATDADPRGIVGSGFEDDFGE